MQTNPHAPTQGAPQPHDGRVTLTRAQPEKLLRLPAVCEKTGLGKSSVYALADFPKPLILSRRAVAWKESEIEAWIASRSKRVEVQS